MAWPGGDHLPGRTDQCDNDGVIEGVDGMTLQARGEMYDDLIAVQGHELEGVRVESVERADDVVRIRMASTDGRERSWVELRTALEHMLAAD